ncbi:hypothetical protein FPSM_01979 [Flavobacterium psychrophilum]|nr:hypothetical protein FPSM_01979 [Flavobacterium psychrophilum]
MFNYKLKKLNKIYVKYFKVNKKKAASYETAFNIL